MEIVLHLGAHKTATTYIQSSLFTSMATLKENGVFIVPTVEFRKTLKHVLSGSNYLNRLVAVKAWRMARVYQNFLRDAQEANCHRIVISEEGMLGSVHGITNDGAFYVHKKLEKSLVPTIRYLKSRPVTAMLAVRSYDSFFTSAWSQTVKEQGFRNFDELDKRRLLSMKRGWFDVIGDVLNILPPGSKIRVWRYEDFIKNEMSVFSELVGPENINHITLPNKNLLPGLSAQAVIMLEKLKLKGEPTPREVVLGMVKQYSKQKGFDSYSPWNEQEKQILVARYEDDLARIRAKWPDIMVHE